MTAPHSHLLEGSPRLHYLEWNPDAPRTIVLLHGNSANAWWWEPVARAIAPEYRLLALDQRGHGDSEWARPAAYSPADYANDIARFVAHVDGECGEAGRRGSQHGRAERARVRAQIIRRAARGAMAIDVAVTSSRGRDRYLRRLKALPVVTYPDLATAKARFRLMPNEGGIAEEVLHEIAEKSLARTDEGRWTLKVRSREFSRRRRARGARDDQGNQDSHDAGARRAQPYHDGGGGGASARVESECAAGDDRRRASSRDPREAGRSRARDRRVRGRACER